MRKFPLRVFGILAGLLIGAALLNSYVFEGGFFSGRLGAPGTFLFEKTRTVAAWFQGIKRWGALIQENADLKRQNADLLASAAKLDDVEKENELLRQAARVAEKVPQDLIPAGLFALTLDATGHHAMLNKGSRNGVRSEDIVVSGEGVLIGSVEEVFAATARVRLIKDPTFEVTARVAGRATTGLVRGNLSRGLVFDFVAQQDEIQEGDTVVSTGSDRFPAGLVIGQVAHVEVNETKVFKEVRIDPAMEAVATGRVLVIHNP
jgi:rod shape-determining protein MreC